MILTLGLFLTPKEQKTSRLFCSPITTDDGDGVSISNIYHYEPGLFLQGYASVRRYLGWWYWGRGEMCVCLCGCGFQHVHHCVLPLGLRLTPTCCPLPRVNLRTTVCLQPSLTWINLRYNQHLFINWHP